jgi:hypothetical protein
MAAEYTWWVRDEEVASLTYRGKSLLHPSPTTEWSTSPQTIKPAILPLNFLKTGQITLLSGFETADCYSNGGLL